MTALAGQASAGAWPGASAANAGLTGNTGPACLAAAVVVGNISVLG